MASQPRVSFIQTSTGRLAYHVVGDGRAGWVIWSQWIAQHLDLLWTDPTIENMIGGLERDGLGSVFLQPRGVGLSDPGSRPPTIDEQAADLLAIMDAERIPSATIAPLGPAPGLPAMLLAAQHPERVHGLVLYGFPLVGPLVDDRAGGWTGESVDAYVSGWSGAGAMWGTGEMLKPWDTGLCSPYNVRLVAMSERCSAPRELAQQFTHGLLEFDARPIAPEVRVPTRVLGVANSTVTLPVQRALAAAIPEASFHPLPATRLGDSLGEAWAPIARHTAEVALGEAARYGRTERVLATVLFTDIVGSTEAVARVGDAAWAATLADYHRLVRREMSAAGGRVVDTTGDGTLCELPSPAAAIRAARAVCEHGRTLEVETRAGVHIGECERLGEDLAGIAVHVGARIGAQAGAGEVLVSRTVRDLVSGSELAFTSRGESELKGVAGRWELFALDQGTPAAAAPALAPNPGGLDRLVVRFARRSPETLRRLNQAGAAIQRRAIAARRT